MAIPELPQADGANAFKPNDYKAPRAEELPEGSVQVTFTMIPQGDNFSLYTHSVGLYDEEGFDNFMNAAAESGVLPQF